jgi:molybdate transport system permease protein
MIQFVARGLMRETKPAFLSFFSILAYVFFVLPIFVLLWRGLNSGAWQNLPELTIVSDAIWLSLQTSAYSLLLSILLGSPLAYIFARWQFRGKKFARVLLELPIIMPPAVAGLALLLTFGRNGFLGMPLEALGIRIPFSTLAVVIAQSFVAAPFYIRSAQLGFESVSQELEDAARVDGASESAVFFWVTLPLSLRAIGAGLVLSWARAMGEFGATILFAGSLQGRTQTMPLLVYSVFERDIDAAIWTGLLLMLVAFLALLLSQWLSGEKETT